MRHGTDALIYLDTSMCCPLRQRTSIQTPHRCPRPWGIKMTTTEKVRNVWIQLIVVPSRLLSLCSSSSDLTLSAIFPVWGVIATVFRILWLVLSFFSSVLLFLSSMYCTDLQALPLCFDHGVHPVTRLEASM